MYNALERWFVPKGTGKRGNNHVACCSGRKEGIGRVAAGVSIISSALCAVDYSADCSPVIYYVLLCAWCDIEWSYWVQCAVIRSFVTSNHTQIL